MHPRSATAAHVCVPATTRAEQLAAAAAWMREGIAQRVHCVYIAENPADPQLYDALNVLGAPPDRPIIVSIPGERPRPLDADWMLAWLRAAIAPALQAGYSGLRICIEMTAIEANEESTEYEARLNDLVQQEPLDAMCIYDRSRQPALYVRESLVTHPLVWVHDATCLNPRYLPPKQYLASDRTEQEVSSFLDQLYRAEMKVLRQRAWLRTTLAKAELERKTISRALHDEIGQTLVVLALANHDGIVHEAIEVVQAMARTLRPSVLDDLGLVAAVRSLANREATRGGLLLDMQSEVDDSRLGAEVVTACYRIAEAAIANVVAHAQATTLTIRLRGEPDMVELVVQDNGVGFGPDVRTGHGLLDMEQRAELVGGLLVIDSRPGAGTTIRVRAPA